jgi:hypothetical protein
MKQSKKRKTLRVMWIVLSIIVLIAVSACGFLSQPQFGRSPKGDRLERIKKSENYRDGTFQNIHETSQITSDKGFSGYGIRISVRKETTIVSRNCIAFH